MRYGIQCIVRQEIEYGAGNLFLGARGSRGRAESATSFLLSLGEPFVTPYQDSIHPMGAFREIGDVVYASARKLCIPTRPTLSSFGSKFTHAVCDRVRAGNCKTVDLVCKVLTRLPSMRLLRPTVSPNETGVPNMGLSEQRRSSRSAAGRSCLLPLRLGPKAYIQKLPDISVVGVLPTHDALGRGPSIE